jgi:5'-methylthioadenosine phosphorylase
MGTESRTTGCGQSWKADGYITLEMVMANLHHNAGLAKQIVARAIPQIPAEPDWPCHSALKNAFLTDKKFWSAKTKKELAPLLAKYL